MSAVVDGYEADLHRLRIKLRWCERKNARLREIVRKQTMFLKEREWCDYDNRYQESKCRDCDAIQPEKHKKDCPYNTAIKLGEGI